LFQILAHDDLFELKNLVSTVLKYKSRGIVRAIFNIYSPETGYTLLHTAIFHNKHEFLHNMLNEFGKLVNVNYRSVDGWLPFELALAIGNKRAIETLLTCKQIDLNLNYPTKKGEPITYHLINSMNLALIERVIKRAPLYF
jgi:ankyrin repeat protein